MGVHVPSSGIWLGFLLLQLIEDSGRYTMRLLSLGHKRPYSFFLVHWGTSQGLPTILKLPHCEEIPATWRGHMLVLQIDGAH